MKKIVLGLLILFGLFPLIVHVIVDVRLTTWNENLYKNAEAYKFLLCVEIWDFLSLATLFIIPLLYILSNLLRLKPGVFTTKYGEIGKYLGLLIIPLYLLFWLIQLFPYTLDTFQDFLVEPKCIEGDVSYLGVHSESYVSSLNREWKYGVYYDTAYKFLYPLEVAESYDVFQVNEKFFALDSLMLLDEGVEQGDMVSLCYLEGSHRIIELTKLGNSTN